MSSDSSISSLLQLVRMVKDTISTNVDQYQSNAHNTLYAEATEVEAALQKAVQDFSKVVNAYRPFNRLPYDVLVRVFELAGRGTPMLKIARVCRWWRQVALDTPYLWAVCELPKDSRYRRLLSNRSKQTPLHLDINMWNGRTSLRALARLTSQQPLRSLRVLFMCYDDPALPLSYLFKAFSLPAPDLKELSLVSGSQLDGQLFEPLFNSQMPQLHTLKFNRVNLWVQCFGPSLRSLTIAEVRNLPMAGLCSALCAVPNLEVLALIGSSLNDIPTREDLTQEPISLQRLQLLRIDVRFYPDQDPYFQWFRFTNLLSTPPSLAKYFDVVDDKKSRWHPGHVGTPIVYSITPRHTVKRYQKFDGLRILKLDHSNDIISISASDDQSVIKLSLKHSNNTWLLKEEGLALETILCELTHVTDLIVNARKDCRTPGQPVKCDLHGRWGALLRLMPSLVRLRLKARSEDVQQILEELHPFNPSPTAAYPAPSLKEIAISDTLAVPNSDVIQAMTLFLEYRQSSGHLIERLEFLESPSSSQIVAQMQSYVQTVVVYRDFHVGSIPIPDHFTVLERGLNL
ncbi:hypothetical protein EWM64_g2546 [Hericium alpestre]|uniref:F-box domain-containing protein n=1 Tax=Hericium alpestre TaxID=135208 RepID=A0A4Z0A4S8_9AGAM|nr:hypothetical protein EWM64_g2546 [Hericium alpestre]